MANRLTLRSFAPGHPVLQSPAYTGFRERMRQIGHLDARVLAAEMEVRTHLPARSKPAASDEIATLKTLRHGLYTAPALLDLARQAQSDNAALGDPFATRNLTLFLNNIDDAAAVSPELEGRINRARSEAKLHLEEARAKSDFTLVRAALAETFAATRERAQAVMAASNGRYTDLYDTVLPGYQTGLTGRRIAEIFTPFRAGLESLIPLVLEHQRKRGISAERIAGECPIADQIAFARELQARMGVDFESGTVHPTTDGSCSEIIHPRDVRQLLKLPLTGFLSNGLRTITHEGGHTLHFQGMDPTRDGRDMNDWYDPAGRPPSHGLSEAMAMVYDREMRLNRGFFSWVYPEIQRRFPVFAGIDSDTAYADMHAVAPGFSRVLSDDLTYHLHIMLRFAIERDLINGTLDVKDLRDRWNTDMKTMLGLDVPNDAKGVLVDIHWYEGWIGYFPVYTLGRIYAHGIARSYAERRGDPTEMFARGEIAPWTEWLQDKVFRHANHVDTDDHIAEIAGSHATAENLLAMFRQRYLA